MRRIAPIAMSLLLVASAVLAVLGSSQRWAADCPFGANWDSRTCGLRQSDVFDAFPEAPWEADPGYAVLLGLSQVLLACALALVPAALRLGARPWQWAAVLAASAGVFVVGAATAVSGMVDRAVDVPVFGLWLFLWVVGMPAALFLLMWRPFADSPRLGGRRMLVLWLLVFSTPLLLHVFVAPLVVQYSSYDTAPWSEAAISPLLLVVALTLRPWRAPEPQSSLSNQQRAHSLSL